MDLDEVGEIIGETISGLESLFVPGCKLTFLMRCPDEPDADLIITADSFDEIRQALDRLESKGVVQFDERGKFVT